MFKFTVAHPNTSISQVANLHYLSPDDIYLWNPALQDTMPTSLSILPVGTVVQLPPQLYYRSNPFGSSFNVAEMARQLQSTAALEREVLARSGHRTDAFVRPVPKVMTKKEHITHSIATGAVANLNKAKGVAKKNATKAVVDPAAAAQNVLDFCELECVSEKNEALMKSHPHVKKPNHVNDDRLQTISDASSQPIDRLKDIRLVFSFFELRSLYALRESWAVVSSQCIGVLIDAIKCKTMLLPSHRTPNSFLFIGGTFYVDDRVAPELGFADITESIRSWDPFMSIHDVGRGEAAQGLLEMKKGFGACPVKKVSETTFGDLRLKMNDFCLFRHCGACDHIFFLSDAGLIPVDDSFTYIDAPYVSRQVATEALTKTSQFPRRVYLAPDRTINCDVCGHLPSSVATYGDSIAPFSPALFCLPCFRTAHCDMNGVEVSDGYVKVELPLGEYF